MFLNSEITQGQMKELKLPSRRSYTKRGPKSDIYTLFLAISYSLRISHRSISYERRISNRSISYVSRISHPHLLPSHHINISLHQKLNTFVPFLIRPVFIFSVLARGFDRILPFPPSFIRTLYHNRYVGPYNF